MAKKVFDKMSKKKRKVSQDNLDFIKSEHKLIEGDTLEDLADELGIVFDLSLTGESDDVVSKTNKVDTENE